MARPSWTLTYNEAYCFAKSVSLRNGVAENQVASDHPALQRTVGSRGVKKIESQEKCGTNSIPAVPLIASTSSLLEGRCHIATGGQA